MPSSQSFNAVVLLGQPHAADADLRSACWPDNVILYAVVA